MNVKVEFYMLLTVFRQPFCLVQNRGTTILCFVTYDLRQLLDIRVDDVTSFRL